MLEIYRDEKIAPPQERSLALKPMLRSWTGRVWRATPSQFQLLLKLDVAIHLTDIDNADLKAALTPFTAELSGFPLYLDYTAEGQLPFSWAVGAFYVEHGKHTFMRFYNFLESIPAHLLVPLLPAAGAQSDLILSVIPYRLEADRLVFIIADYDLGFHNRIG